MGWLRRKADKEEEYPVDEIQIGKNFIDLGALKVREPAGGAKVAGPTIKFADIEGYRQIPELSNLVYEGNVLILDFTPIANDDLELKRAITELKRVVEDINGDIAGIGQNLLVIAPKGMNVDKKKIRRLERKRR